MILVVLVSVDRYGKICKSEGILDIFKMLGSSPGIRSDVKDLAMKTMHFIETNDKERHGEQ